MAELDHKIVGYVVYDKVHTRPTKVLCERKYCYLQQIGVDSKVRELGIGFSLIEHVKTECKKLSINEIELDVWAFNAGGYKFLQKSDLNNMALR